MLIANIESPNSVRNIVTNPQVWVSVVDIFMQKGFKLKGSARHGDKFPIKSIIAMTVNNVKKIIAPSYVLFKETTEKSQIESAMKT